MAPLWSALSEAYKQTIAIDKIRMPTPHSQEMITTTVTNYLLDIY